MLNELTYHAILALIVRINQRICIMFCVLAKHCIIFSHRFSYFGYYDKIRNHLFRDPLNFSFPLFYSLLKTKLLSHQKFHDKITFNPSTITRKPTVLPIYDRSPVLLNLSRQYNFLFSIHTSSVTIARRTNDEKRIKFSVKDNQRLFHPK